MTSSSPYTIERRDDGAVVRFGEIVSHPRTTTHEKELEELVGKFEVVVCDLLHTKAIGSPWIKWLSHVTRKARRAGAVFALVGVSEDIRKNADLIGTLDSLDIRVGDVEMVLRGSEGAP